MQIWVLIFDYANFYSLFCKCSRGWIRLSCTPELQAAFNTGREIGRTEGMLSYQRHLMNQLFNENQKLNEKLREQKGGQQ